MNESLNDGEERAEGVAGQTVRENRRPPGTETCRRRCSKKEAEPADERDALREGFSV